VSYRGFRPGASVTSVTDATGLTAADVRTLHRRPQLIQSLEWRLPYVMGPAVPAGSDPVRRMVFSFYESQLYRIVIDYDRERTEGLTGGDVIEALAATYGLPTVPDARLAAQADAAHPIAQWNAQGAELVLYQSPGFSGRATAAVFMLTMTEPRLAALSVAASADAVRLDASEAPEREVERLKTAADDEEAEAERSRTINKPSFRP
jgi:hypothetical protein